MYKLGITKYEIIFIRFKLVIMLKNNNRLPFLASPSVRLPKIQTPLTERKGKENTTKTVFLEFPIGKKKPIKNQDR